LVCFLSCFILSTACHSTKAYSTIHQALTAMSRWVTFPDARLLVAYSAPFVGEACVVVNIKDDDIPACVNVEKVAFVVFTRSGNEPPKRFKYTFWTEVQGEKYYHHSFMSSYNQCAISYCSEKVVLPLSQSSKRIFMTSDRDTPSNNHGVQIYLSGYKIRNISS